MAAELLVIRAEDLCLPRAGIRRLRGEHAGVDRAGGRGGPHRHLSASGDQRDQDRGWRSAGGVAVRAYHGDGAAGLGERVRLTPEGVLAVLTTHPLDTQATSIELPYGVTESVRMPNTCPDSHLKGY